MRMFSYLGGITLIFIPVYWWYGYLDCLHTECHAHAILSGSMEPAIPRGSVVIVRREKPEDYHQGDVVSVLIPGHEQTIVTHRIRQLFQYPSGVRGVETKGDANTSGDAWRSSLGAIIGRQVAVIYGLGFVVGFLKTTLGLVGVYVTAVSWLVFAFVSPLWRKYCM